jgi:hypothetical protein
MYRWMGLLVAGALLASGCSSGEKEEPSAKTGSSAPSASTSASAGSGTSDLAQLAGKWRFTVKNPRLSFGTGRYVGAKVSLAGSAIHLQSVVNANTYGEIGVIVGEVVIDCPVGAPFGCQSDDQFFGRVGNGLGLVDFGGEPRTWQKVGGEKCGAPGVANYGLVQQLTGTSFTYVDAQETGVPGQCYQVVWDVVATKV